jgi:hypothetical protein
MPTFGRRSYDLEYMRVFSSAMSSLKELRLAPDVADREVGLIRALIVQGTQNAIEVRLIREEEGVTVLAHITPPPTYQDAETYASWVDSFFNLLDTNVREGRRATVDVRPPEPRRRVTFDVRKAPVHRSDAARRYGFRSDTELWAFIFVVIGSLLALIGGLPSWLGAYDLLVCNLPGFVCLLLSAGLIKAREFLYGYILAVIGGLLVLPIGIIAWIGAMLAWRASREKPNLDRIYSRL